MSPIVLLILLLSFVTLTISTTREFMFDSYSSSRQQHRLILPRQQYEALITNSSIKTFNSFRNITTTPFVPVRSSSEASENSLITYDSLKNTNKFPLENAFKMSVYRLNVNQSTPCNYTGKEKLIKCHRVSFFDMTLYQNAIKDARNLILSRIGLRNEPSNVNMNRNTVKLLSGINRMSSSSSENKQKQQQVESAKRTQFDQKDKLQGKTVKLMRELTDIVKCDAVGVFKKPITNAICLNFINDDRLFSQKLYTKSYSSVFLWLNFDIKESSSSSGNKKAATTLLITNLRQEVTLELSAKQGWNSVDISNLIKANKFINETVFDTFIVKCAKDCIIDIAATASVKLTHKTVSAKHSPAIVYLNNYDNQRPLLQINNEQMVRGAQNKRDKRSVDAQRTNTNKNTNTNSENESVIVQSTTVSADTATTDSSSIGSNLCKNNIGHPNRECCLVSHYVSFNELKWSNWIMSPLGYRANYCIGRCTSAKDHSNATYNGDFKQRYNQFFAAKFPNNKNQLSTCCHPISTSSMKIKHLLRNGTIVTSVVPNMIITACGCS